MKDWEMLNNTDSSFVGDYLLTQIKSMGIKIKDLANGIGLHPATLGNKLHGHNAFRKIEVKNVCAYLGINYEDVFDKLDRSKDVTCYEEKKQNFIECSLNKDIENRVLQLTLKLFDVAKELTDKYDKDCYDIKALSSLVNSICNLLYGGNNNGKNSNN